MPAFRTLSLVSLAVLATAAAQAAPLTVAVSGIEARGGTLYVGVQTEDQFLQNAGVAGEMLAAPAAGERTFTFNLPEGVYSVSVWHDFNANGQFDMSEAGLPADGWGMINGESLRGTPTFDAVSIAVPAEGTSAAIRVAYPD